MNSLSKTLVAFVHFLTASYPGQCSSEDFSLECQQSVGHSTLLPGVLPRKPLIEERVEQVDRREEVLMLRKGVPGSQLSRSSRTNLSPNSMNTSFKKSPSSSRYLASLVMCRSTRPWRGYGNSLDVRSDIETFIAHRSFRSSRGFLAGAVTSSMSFASSVSGILNVDNLALRRVGAMSGAAVELQ